MKTKADRRVVLFRGLSIGVAVASVMLPWSYFRRTVQREGPIEVRDRIIGIFYDFGDANVVEVPPEARLIALIASLGALLLMLRLCDEYRSLVRDGTRRPKVGFALAFACLLVAVGGTVEANRRFNDVDNFVEATSFRSASYDAYDGVAPYVLSILAPLLCAVLAYLVWRSAVPGTDPVPEPSMAGPPKFERYRG